MRKLMKGILALSSLYSALKQANQKKVNNVTQGNSDNNQANQGTPENQDASANGAKNASGKLGAKSGKPKSAAKTWLLRMAARLALPGVLLIGAILGINALKDEPLPDRTSEATSDNYEYNEVDPDLAGHDTSGLNDAEVALLERDLKNAMRLQTVPVDMESIKQVTVALATAFKEAANEADTELTKRDIRDLTTFVVQEAGLEIARAGEGEHKIKVEGVVNDFVVKLDFNAVTNGVGKDQTSSLKKGSGVKAVVKPDMP
jgi:hypothetical protein